MDPDRFLVDFYGTKMIIYFSGNHKIYAKQMKAFIKAETGKESLEKAYNGTDWGDCTEEVSNQLYLFNVSTLLRQ